MQAKELIDLKTMQRFLVKAFFEVSKTDMDGKYERTLGIFFDGNLACVFKNDQADSAYVVIKEKLCITNGIIAFEINPTCIEISDEEDVRKDLKEKLLKGIPPETRTFLGIK